MAIGDTLTVNQLILTISSCSLELENHLKNLEKKKIGAIKLIKEPNQKIK